MIGFIVVITGEAQTPAPGAKVEAQTFSFFFDGDGSYLGVQTEEITKDNFAKYGLRDVRGVAVEKVMEGSPAEKAGIQSGDVIVGFNNEEITSVRKLMRLLGEVSPDHQAKITVLRSGGERELTATLGLRPAPKFEEGAFGNLPRVQRVPFPPSADMPSLAPMQSIPSTPGTPDRPFVWRSGSGRRIGVGVTSLTKQLSEHFGVAGGVMINEVRSDSPAAKAGLKAGDIIVEIESNEVKGEMDLIRAIGEKKDGDVRLTIVRDRNRQTIRVTPEESKDGFNSFFEFPNAPDGMVAPQQFKMAVPMTPMPMTGFQFPNRIL
ncbi:MAG: PDZ domain-containing protein [Acidobacteriota bacterium]